MKGEMGSGSWLNSLWPVSRKNVLDNKAVVGILALEVASLMSKITNLWRSLSDWEVLSLREGIVNSVGIKMLVSEEDDYLMELVLNDILDNFRFLAQSVVRFGKRCTDPVYHRFEHFVCNPVQNYIHWSGWEYKWKKMEKKVKKMEKMVASTTQYCQELEVLAEVEQTFRRMQANPELHRLKLLEFQKKVACRRQEVRNLRDTSPWNRSYEYVVRLLVKSLFTILERIILVFGNNHHPSLQQGNDSHDVNANNFLRSQSFSVFMHSSIYPSENDLYGFNNSGSVGRRPYFLSNKSKKTKEHKKALHPSDKRGKHKRSESKQLGNIGPFKSCMSVTSNSPVIQSCVQQTNGYGGSMRLPDSHTKHVDKMKTAENSSLSSRIRIYSKLRINNISKPGSLTLGDAALALHYANMIVLIEKMASSPHSVDLKARDDLYNMLPTSIRIVTRAKLKCHATNKSSSFHDADIVAKWSTMLAQTLEWLAPLAHNTISWYSERNYEREHAAVKANVLLVQTLFYANQGKAEAAMVDLLVGLNYVFKIETKVGMRDRCEWQ
ncbi:protein PSK SIMULATOR 1 [Lathyrus oleraceus]|uniref:Uncharacterized protein n=1 Tax=Pisum sativum TaxID=3888 RepID=A0A9D4XVT3_PEA|nr:protein PSK SIMULATOR 1-like [Pisum sativum]KAI5425626.1 hypothetical protein KIW84_031444 [Pisum sativum]